LRHIEEPQSVVLAMEMFMKDDQDLIDAFMSDSISEETFTKKIDYHRSWGFPWAHYLPILQWAKEHAVTVLGINFKGTIAQRDMKIAAHLQEIGNRLKNRKLVVMIGEHHLADQHLPMRMAEKGIDANSVLRLFTNAEKYYFSDEREQVNNTDYLDLGRNRYCILNCPPWIKWQSVTVFAGMDESDVDDGWFESEFEEDNPDDRFYAILHNLTAFLQISNIPNIDDFYIYRSNSADFFLHLNELYDRQAAGIFMSIAESEGVLFPLQGRGLYLGENTQNNMVQMAGEYLRGVYCGDEINAEDERELFLAMMLNACAGRVASKIFNPRRKGLTLDDARAAVAASGRKRLLGAAKQQRQVFKSVLSLYELLVQGKVPSQRSRVWRDDALSNFAVARSLGNILGLDIYQAVIRGQAPKELLIDLFTAKTTPLDLLERAYRHRALPEERRIA
jgi:hypothetical protein